MSTHKIEEAQSVTLRGGAWGGRSDDDPPCINVKCQRFPRDVADPHAKMREEFGELSDTALELAFGCAWNTAVRDFWDHVAPDIAEEFLTPAFNPERSDAADFEINSDGRSGGWLVVRGLPPVYDWTPAQLGAWAAFEEAIGKAIDGLASYESARDTILQLGALELQTIPQKCPACGSDDLRVELEERIDFLRSYNATTKALAFDGRRDAASEHPPIPHRARLYCGCGVETPIALGIATAWAGED